MRFNTLLGERTSSSAGWWPERLAAVLALGSIVLVSLPGFHVRTWHGASSDFKTLYASARCFATGLRAYNFPNIGHIFDISGVVRPPFWYAHAPTYPPFTFGVLYPFTLIPMVQAVYIWLALGTAALILAVWFTASFSERELALGRGWRILIIAAVAASPLVSFGLQIGNVSVIAGAFCIMAVMSPARYHLNWRAIAVTISVLLKPHIGLWLLVGMFFSRNREDRALVFRTAWFTGSFLALFSLWISIHHPLGLQLGDYFAMVRSEIATGCLNPRNHELLPVFAQVTSLESFFGFFLPPPWMQIVSGSLLLIMAGILIFVSRIPRNNQVDTRLELLGAWSTFGLLVTYHRSHDAIILFLMLPWIFVRLRRTGSDFIAWSSILLLAALSVGTFPPDFSWVTNALGAPALADFLVFRQCGLATLLLMILLLAHLARRTPASKVTGDRRIKREILIERGAGVIAFGCLMAINLGQTQPRLWQESLGDFKMVYASAAGLLHDGNAYSFDELTRAFREGGVVQPVSWFGHSPVYPPFTLLALSPMLLLPLVPAAYLWACLSYLALAAASLRLARYAARTFCLPLGFRLLLIALMAASPLVSFGLSLANLSMVSAGLCIFAATSPSQPSAKSAWLCAIGLAVALLLKPHLAFWMVLALLLLPRHKYGKNERTLALRAVVIFGGLLVPMVCYLLLRHQLGHLVQSYVHVLRAEAAGGSMDARARGYVLIPAQITSLASLLGYWVLASRTLLGLQLIVLLPLAFCLLLATSRSRPEWKSAVISGWVVFGLLVTYHRAHDGTLLFLMLPLLLARVWRRWYDIPGWTLLALYFMFSFATPPEWYQNVSSPLLVREIAQFLLLRQIALATVLMAVALIVTLWLLGKRNSVPIPKSISIPLEDCSEASSQFSTI
jgi:hypothetical protein